MQALLGLKPVAVPAEVQGAQLLAGLADQVAFADEDLIGLRRFPSYAENPRIPREPRGRRVIIGITDRPVARFGSASACAASEDATFGGVSRDHDLGQIPEGYRWCPHCNGYGSSLGDANDRCVRCNGTGLAAADRPCDAASAPTNGTADW